MNLVDVAASDCHIDSYQLISDTVFAGGASGIEELKKLVDLAGYILSHGVRQSLPIRGAITYGAYQWGRLTYGKAVIRAHQLEMAQNWIGVTCDADLPSEDTLFKLDSLVRYPAPMKGSLVRLYPVVAWDIPKCSQLQSLLCRGGLTRDREEPSWEWADKLNNTLMLRMYRNWLAANKKSGKVYYGGSPLQVLSEQCLIPDGSD